MGSFTKVNQDDSDENPLWVNDAPRITSFDSLEGNQSADVVIVGAGVAGLSLAYHLTQLGTAPIVLEATLPGSDATGKSAGIVTSLPVLRNPAALIKKCGETKGNDLLSLFGSSAKYTFSLIASLELDCGQLPRGFLAPARPSKSVESLKSAAGEWESLGYGIQFIDESRTRFLTGLDHYRGALLDPDGGALNPLAYARELARVVQDGGAKIFAQSRVNNFYKTQGHWKLECQNGAVKAKQVIFCAGGGNRFLHSMLERSALPLRVYQMATEPLHEDKNSVILPEKHSMTDVHPNLFSMRYDTKNRLVTACPAFLFANSANRAKNSILRRLEKISPLLNSISIDYIWSGTVWLNTSILPKFYSLSEGLYAVQACNGRGLAINTILGKDIAEYIYSNGTSKTRIQPEASGSIRPYAIAAHLPQLLINSARLRSNMFEVKSD